MWEWWCLIHLSENSSSILPLAASIRPKKVHWHNNRFFSTIYPSSLAINEDFFFLQLDQRIGERQTRNRCSLQLIDWGRQFQLEICVPLWLPPNRERDNLQKEGLHLLSGGIRIPGASSFGTSSLGLWQDFSKWLSRYYCIICNAHWSFNWRLGSNHILLSCFELSW